MVRWLSTLCVLLGVAWSVPAAAGLFGGGPPGRIPIPAAEFSATVEDVGGTSLVIERMSFDGEVFLFGTVGKAQVTFPFATLQTATFLPGDDEDHRVVEVTDRAGTTLRVVVKADRKLTGRTAFGNYRIEAADIRRIAIASTADADRR